MDTVSQHFDKQKERQCFFKGIQSGEREGVKSTE